MRTIRPFLAIACVLSFSLSAPAWAEKKAHPDSRTGHGQAADRWYIKNSETVAKCGGPVSQQVNPANGATSTVCRVNGRVVEVEPAPRGKGQ